MDYSILGPVEVWDERGRLPVRRPKELCLLAVLLLRANQLVSLDHLSDELWPERPPAKPAEAVQELVYQLRKAIEVGRPRGSVIERQGDGYRIVVPPDALDLHKFERLVRAAAEARHRDELEAASWTLSEALSVWRGSPLANIAPEPATSLRAEVERLHELRLNVSVERLEIELELGQESDAIPELDHLIAGHPLDERLRALLMLALYRAGRQADALAVYQATRSTLLEELGIEPGRPLHELQKAILRQDSELEPHRRRERRAPSRSDLTDRAIVAWARDSSEIEALLAISEPLGRSQLARELIVALITSPEESALAEANAAVLRTREQLLERGTSARAVAFTSPAPADDAVRLASREGVDLLLLACSAMSEDGQLAPDIASALEAAPCDTVLVIPRPMQPAGSVVVPFGALEHDWASLELGAWVASAHQVPLILVGTGGALDARERDSSRLLAEASLLVQQFLNVHPVTRLVETGADGILAASQDAGFLVLGLPDRWRQDGVGALRASIVRRAPSPVLLVRKGTRPGGLAPRDTATIFAWSLQRASAAEAVVSGGS